MALTRPSREALLWLSLGLNAALLVAVTMFWQRARVAPFPGPPGMPSMFAPGREFPPDFARISKRLELSPRQERDILAIFGEAREDAAKRFDAMHEARLRLIRQVIANPEDEAAIDAIVARDADVPQAMIRTMTGHIRRVALELTPAQRKLLLEEFASEAAETAAGS